MLSIPAPPEAMMGMLTVSVNSAKAALANPFWFRRDP